MICIENNISEDKKKKLCEDDIKKTKRKLLSSQFILYIYSLSILAILKNFTEYSLMQMIKENVLLSTIVIIAFAIVYIIYFFLYTAILDNAYALFSTIKTHIKKISFLDNSLEIELINETLSIPIDSFNKENYFAVNSNKKFLFLHFNEIYLLEQKEEKDKKNELNEILLNYQKNIPSIKKINQEDYSFHFQILNSYLYEFIYNAKTIYNLFGLSKFDFFTLVFIVVDLLTTKIGLWLFFISRIIFFVLHCLILTYLKNIHQKNISYNCIFSFTNNEFAMFSNNQCLLFADNNEIIDIIPFKNFTVINTLKGHFIIENNDKSIDILSKNLMSSNIQKYPFKNK